MDHFFDQAARILASEMPRRRALLRLGGLIAGGLLATFGVSVEAQVVCGSTTCKKNEKCCTTGSQPFCTEEPKLCCGNTSCPPGKQCCPGNGFPFCANKPETCCGNTSCKENETCCGNACCSKKQTCVSGACVGSPS